MFTFCILNFLLSSFDFLFLLLTLSILNFIMNVIITTFIFMMIKRFFLILISHISICSVISSCIFFRRILNLISHILWDFQLKQIHYGLRLNDSGNSKLVFFLRLLLLLRNVYLEMIVAFPGIIPLSFQHSTSGCCS